MLTEVIELSVERALGAGRQGGPIAVVQEGAQQPPYPALFVPQRGAPALVVGLGLRALAEDRFGGRVQMSGGMIEVQHPDCVRVVSGEEVPIPLRPVS